MNKNEEPELRDRRSTAAGSAALARAVLGMLLCAEALAEPAERRAVPVEADFRSQYLAVGLSRSAPAFTVFAVDSLGLGQVDQNPVLQETNTVPGLSWEGKFACKLSGQPAWQVTCGGQALTLRSTFVAAAASPSFMLTFDQRTNHATLLGLMPPGERRVRLPCVMHLPDRGSVRITCNVAGRALDYDASRSQAGMPPFVQVGFPPATAGETLVEYRLEVVAIHPPLPGVESDARYAGFRRAWLNIFQVNPRIQMLANNAASDSCAFCIYSYADIARHTPPLAEGLAALDLVRMTLDRYLAGVLGYGQAGYWPTPWTSLDSLPSLLLAACIYVEGSQDLPWGRRNYDKLAAWAREMMASDRNGNGLIEYPRTGNYGDRPRGRSRPANWWDTINFGHEDAYANALAYRACTMFSELARQLGHASDAGEFAAMAAKLRAAYAPTFLNPETGILAGWKSADGSLHDYWFTFVNGAAIAYGLIDDRQANAIMDRILEKMQQVGYTNFALGLPGNLVPVRKGDYLRGPGPPQHIGVPEREDGSDGFQAYENGGATACWAYFTLKALYKLGRVADARRILHPMLGSFARGEFQGFGENGRSRDWRDWKGGCHGYEGLLVDNYFALLAVLDDRKVP